MGHFSPHFPFKTNYLASEKQERLLVTVLMFLLKKLKVLQVTIYRITILFVPLTVTQDCKNREGEGVVLKGSARGSPFLNQR